MPEETKPAAAAAHAPHTPVTPAPLPILPDPVMQLNAIDQALQTLAAEEKSLRDELAVKDPLESTADTLFYANELLIVVRAIDHLKGERAATIRRLAGGFGI